MYVYVANVPEVHVIWAKNAGKLFSSYCHFVLQFGQANDCDCELIFLIFFKFASIPDWWPGQTTPSEQPENTEQCLLISILVLVILNWLKNTYTPHEDVLYFKPQCTYWCHVLTVVTILSRRYFQSFRGLTRLAVSVKLAVLLKIDKFLPLVTNVSICHNKQSRVDRFRYEVLLLVLRWWVGNRSYLSLLRNIEILFLFSL